MDVGQLDIIAHDWTNAMHIESTIVERVETIVRHPVFAGSDKAMDLVLDDLETMVDGGRIHQGT